MLQRPDTGARPADLRARPRAARFVLGLGPVPALGILVLAGFALAAVFAPLIVADPSAIAPSQRLAPPGTAHVFGTDRLGRDVLDRTIYGARISLFVGVLVSVLTVIVGLAMNILGDTLCDRLDPRLKKVESR